MNILLITDDFYPYQGGISQHLSSLCQKFREKDHKLFVINPGYGNGKDLFKIIYKNKNFRKQDLFLQNSKFYYYLVFIFCKILINKKSKLSNRLRILIYFTFRPKILLNQIQNFMRIKELCDKLKFDLILTGSAGFPLQVGYIVSTTYNKKLVTLAHGDDFLYKTRLSIGSAFLKNVDGVIISNKLTRYLVRKIHGINKNKLKIIHYGLILENYKVNQTKEQLRSDFSIPHDQFIILCIGRHVPRKRYDLVIKAIKLIMDSDSSIKLKCFMIGEGPMTESYKDLVNELEISNYVEFLGAFGGLKRNKYYKLSDIFIMISVSLKHSIEGFGIVFLEANYYNLPCIGSSSGGIRCAIENNKTGFLINPNDLEELKEKIKILYEDRDLREKMGYYAHQRVLNEYNWDILIVDYINYFKELLSEKKISN